MSRASTTSVAMVSGFSAVTSSAQAASGAQMKFAPTAIAATVAAVRDRSARRVSPAFLRRHRHRSCFLLILLAFPLAGQAAGQPKRPPRSITSIW